MLTVKASAKSSKVHGIGLFADEKILRGVITWKFHPKFDILFDPFEVNKMPVDQQELIKNYAYLSKESGKYVYSIDDSRFTNHSIKNNIDSVSLPGEIEKVGMANKDIEPGEEILANYRLFDAHDEKSTDEYLDV
ncbi:MAG: SET domain-containing protein [Candidatus Magasanikbacteria bacterium]|nr:SET domain-containing protein [Candidatus Magasanikbacteria bacterium]